MAYGLRSVIASRQETQLSLTNRATRLKDSQGHQSFRILGMVSY